MLELWNNGQSHVDEYEWQTKQTADTEIIKSLFSYERGAPPPIHCPSQQRLQPLFHLPELDGLGSQPSLPNLAAQRTTHPRNALNFDPVIQSQPFAYQCR